MRNASTLAWAIIKPPGRAILKVLRSYKGLIEILKELRYLYATGAPWVLYGYYLKGLILNPKTLRNYAGVHKKFVAKKSSLKLSNDWFSHNVAYWHDAFERFGYQDKTIQALEVGSWEGLSSYFVLQALPKATITCVDTWEGADEHKDGVAATASVLNQIEQAFDSNLQSFQSRLTKYKGTSFSYFMNTETQTTFDLIYIDGSHHSDDVIVDAVKGFSLLKEGGIMIFDDYFWQYYPNAIDNPAGAINTFLRLKKGQYQVVRLYYQLIIRKI